MNEGDPNINSKPKVPLGKDPNAIGVLFDKNTGEALGHEGASLPYSGGSPTSESGGKKVSKNELKQSI